MSTPAGACPDTEALCAVVEGRIGEDDREALEAHLDVCASCRRALVEVGRAVSGPSAPPSNDASRATRLGRYEIRREVAVGGMGVVYEGWDPALGRRVALKLVRPDRAGTTEALADEARALAKVVHPNVVTVFDVGVEGGAVFLAAEYIEGTTMDKAWPRRARSFRDRIEAYLQAARGLGAVHAAGITHRDIKPSNLLIGTDGRVRITDFGLAVGTGNEATPAGTPGYVAPEQRRGEATPAADQFSLAVCLVEALLGVRVPADTSSQSLVLEGRRVWGVDGPAPATWSVLARALASDPFARHADIDAFVRAIEASIDRVDDAGPATRRWPFAIGGLAVLVSAVVAVVWLQRARHVPSADATSSKAAGASAVVPSAVVMREVGDAGSGIADAHSAREEPSTSTPAVRTAVVPSDVAAREVVTDPISADPLSEAGKAREARDGKKCLEILDAAARRRGGPRSGEELVRGSCEMLIGDCSRGFERIRATSGSNRELVARLTREMFCPTDDPSLSPEERLRAIGRQAVNQLRPWPSARCEQFRTQVERAIGEAPSLSQPRGPDAPGLVAWASVISCFAWAGDCARAEQLAKTRYPFPDEDAAKAWVSQLHPNCKK
jgi:serine/threonine protein kinase